MNQFTSKYFNYILASSCFLGFLIPSPEAYTSYIILGLLFHIILVSFIQLDSKQSHLRADLKILIPFSLLRFIGLPIATFLIISKWNELYAFALSFLLLLPPGASSPMISKILKGNFSLSFNLLIINSILSVITISIITPYISRQTVSIDFMDLFKPLILTIFIPYLIQFPIKKIESAKNFVISNSSTLVVTSLSVIFILAIAKNKEFILEYINLLPKYFALGLIFYLLLYIIGYLLYRKKSSPIKTSTSLGSGLNNIGLGVSLSLIYFTPTTTLLFLSFQFIWVILLIPVKIILFKISSAAQ